MRTKRAFWWIGSTSLAFALVAGGCDAGPPAPIQRTGGGAGGETRRAPAKAAEPSSPGNAETGDEPESGGPPAKTADQFPQEVQQKFQQFVTMIEEAKQAKQAFHDNPTEESHTAAYDKIGEAMTLGYEINETAPDFPRFQEYFAELGVMNSDLKEFEPK